jgi:hypothetical protein
MKSPEKTVVCGINCSACLEAFFVYNPLDVKENVEHALDFALHLSHFFGLGEFGLAILTPLYSSCFLPQMFV